MAQDSYRCSAGGPAPAAGSPDAGAQRRGVDAQAVRKPPGPFDPQLPLESLHARPVPPLLRAPRSGGGGKAAGRPCPAERRRLQQPDSPKPLRGGTGRGLSRRRGLGPHRRRGRRRSGRCGLRGVWGSMLAVYSRHGRVTEGPSAIPAAPGRGSSTASQQQPQHRTALRPIPPLDETGQKQQGSSTAEQSGTAEQPLNQGHDHRASPFSSYSRAGAGPISC
jgi:hypothetical protein